MTDQTASEAQTAAKDRYWNLQDAIDQILRKLRTETGRSARTGLLTMLAVNHQAAARCYSVAYEDGLQADVEFHNRMAQAYSMLADVEGARVDQLGATGPLAAQIEDVAGDVLARMAATNHLSKRTAMLAELAEAVTPVLGPTVARAIELLPTPDGWLPYITATGRPLWRDPACVAMVAITVVAAVALGVALWLTIGSGEAWPGFAAAAVGALAVVGIRLIGRRSRRTS